MFRRRPAAHPVSFPMPPIPDGPPIVVHSEAAPAPRLRVWKIDQDGLNLPWAWIVRRGSEPVDASVAYTHAEALAVGLAALERHSLPGRRP